MYQLTVLCVIELPILWVSLKNMADLVGGGGGEGAHVTKQAQWIHLHQYPADGCLGP